MDNLRKLSWRKRCIIIFSVLACLFVSYFSIFSVQSSANSSVVPNLSNIYVSGSPVDVSGLIFRYASIDGSPPEDVIFNDAFFLPGVNTYLMSPGGVPNWNQSPVFSVDEPSYSFNFLYDQLNSVAADVFVSSSKSVSALRFDVNTDIFVSDLSDIPNFNIDFGLRDVSYDRGSTFNVSYRYHLNRAYLNSSGDVTVGDAFYQSARRVTVVDDGYSVFPLFLSEIWHSHFIEDNNDFYDKITGKWYCWIDYIEVIVEPSVETNLFYVSSVTGGPVPLSNWYLDQSKVLRSIFSADIASVDFDSISWTDWITNAVGSFLNFQIVPGISFSGILAFLIAMSLFMMFLKFFAGG